MSGNMRDRSEYLYCFPVLTAASFSSASRRASSLAALTFSATAFIRDFGLTDRRLGFSSLLFSTSFSTTETEMSFLSRLFTKAPQCRGQRVLF